MTRSNRIPRILGVAATAAMCSTLALAPAASGAQTYRCEVNGRVTFQQQACNDGRRVQGTGAAPEAVAAAPRGAALCEAHARSPAAFADPQGLRIASVKFLGARAWRLHSELIAARSYGLRINAPNQYGGFDGERLFECLLSEDEARVLHFGIAAAAAGQPK
jgi:Domain of unknown function (DUF4124)